MAYDRSLSGCPAHRLNPKSYKACGFDFYSYDMISKSFNIFSDHFDFDGSPLQMVFQPSQIFSSYAEIPIFDDDIVEGNESFIAVILRSSKYERDILTEDPDVVTIGIIDNDSE